MPEVLEIEQVETEKQNLKDSKIASWLVEIPRNVIEELSLPEGSQVALTIKNDRVSGTVLPPLPNRMKEIGQRVLEKNREVYEELKRLGD
jgi:antitoxin component of MazEF toxin-antitoxin module